LFQISLAQDIYSLKSGKISFFAGTPIEDIDATNLKSTSFLNIKTGEIIISTPVKEFKFKRALMEEHFNENYLESDKYPKSEFKGKIIDIQSVDFGKTGDYKVFVEGNLTMHGVTKNKRIEVVLSIAESKIQAKTNFQVLLEEYNIDRPKVVWEKLAEKVDLKVELNYEPYKK
jgi:polyisoprenoid-binding protein YceI